VQLLRGPPCLKKCWELQSTTSQGPRLGVTMMLQCLHVLLFFHSSSASSLGPGPSQLFRDLCFELAAQPCAVCVKEAAPFSIVFLVLSSYPSHLDARTSI